MESGKEVCKPESMNVILMQSQAFKEGRDGRGERPETSHIHAAMEVAVGRWGIPETENGMDQGLEVERNGKSQETGVLVTALLFSFLSLGLSIHQMGLQ